MTLRFKKVGILDTIMVKGFHADIVFGAADGVGEGPSRSFRAVFVDESGAGVGD